MKLFYRSVGKPFTLSILLFISTNAVQSQWIQDPEIDQRVQRGIDYIYNFDFDKADTAFSQVIAVRPEHPVGYFFRAMIQWEKILCNFDDESQDDKLYTLLDVVVDMCDKRLDKNPKDVTALFFKGGAVGFRGRLRANRGKWIGAANDGLIALPLVRKAYELEPKNYDVLLGMGIYNYYAAVIPDKYPIVKPVMIFFPGGDRKKGLEQLKIASENAKYARIEAIYFLMQNYFMFEKDYSKALELAKMLHARYPKNSIFYRFYGRCLVSTGYLGEANFIFNDIAKLYENKQFGFDSYDGREAYYYIGKFEFLANRYESAERYLFKCDELSRRLDIDGASGFMSLSNLLLGMIYDVRGQREYAIKQYNKVLDMREYENSYIEARTYLKNPYAQAR